MNKYETVKTILRDKNQFIMTDNIQKAKDRLYDIIYSNDRGIYLFTGEQGAGKSLIIDRLISTIKDDIYLYRDIENRNNERTILEGLYRLIKKKSLASNIALDEVKNRVNDAYQKVNHTIIIDNADQLEESTLEKVADFFRENSKLKVIFVADITTSKDSEFFNSIIHAEEQNLTVLSNYNNSEIIKYYEQLLKFNFFKNDLKAISKYSELIEELTGGNLKAMRTLLSNLFKVLIASEENSIKRFSKINECVLTMSALEGGLIDG